MMPIVKRRRGRKSKIDKLLEAAAMDAALARASLSGAGFSLPHSLSTSAKLSIPTSASWSAAMLPRGADNSTGKVDHHMSRDRGYRDISSRELAMRQLAALEMASHGEHSRGDRKSREHDGALSARDLMPQLRDLAPRPSQRDRSDKQSDAQRELLMSYCNNLSRASVELIQAGMARDRDTGSTRDGKTFRERESMMDDIPSMERRLGDRVLYKEWRQSIDKVRFREMKFNDDVSSMERRISQEGDGIELGGEGNKIRGEAETSDTDDIPTLPPRPQGTSRDGDRRSSTEDKLTGHSATDVRQLFLSCRS